MGQENRTINQEGLAANFCFSSLSDMAGKLCTSITLLYHVQDPLICCSERGMNDENQRLAPNLSGAGSFAVFTAQLALGTGFQEQTP